MQKLLQKIIEEEIQRILFEEEESPANPSSPNPADPTSSSLTQDSGDVNSMPAEPASQSNPQTPPPPPGAASVPGMSAQTPAMDTSTGVSGGGTSQSTSPAGEFDAGAPDQNSTEPSEDGLPEDFPEDPDEEMKTTAKDIIEKTNNTQKALKSIKGIMQDKYQDPSQAESFVFDLSNETDPRMKDIARRLFLYLTGR